MEGQCIHKYEAEIIGSVDHPYNFKPHSGFLFLSQKSIEATLAQQKKKKKKKKNQL